MGLSLEQIIIDKNGININKTNLNNIIEKVFNIDNIIKNNIEGQISPLKKISLDYIQQLQNLLKEIQILINEYENEKRLLELLKKEGQYYAQQLAKNHLQINTNFNIKEIYKNLIIQTDIYTAKVQEILGKKYQIIYVYQSDAANVIQVYKINRIEDLISLRKTSSGGIEQRLTASKTKLESLNNALIKKEQYTIGLQQASLLDIVYKEVIRRYNIRKNPHLILWNVGTSSSHCWHLMKLYQKGDLTQAYASFVLNYYGAPFIGNVNNPPETDIEIFMLAVEEVDATFGGIQGDISNRINNTEYAIKTLKASPQGVMKTIDMAKDIIQNNFNKEEFEKYKEKMKKEGRNTIQELTIGEAEIGLKTIVDKI